MSQGAALLSGATAAISLNLMHECARQIMPDPPRIDVIGMRAVAKAARAMGFDPPENLRTTALAGDLLANTLFYSSVAAAGKSEAIVHGALAGFAAGIGTLLFPEPLGLGDAEVNRTPQTQAMAAGMYLVAGLIAGITYRTLTRGSD
ncbi:MAG: hypothetical protein H7039_06725 [Bryobacteraceae bacterium]|nr:hypothetical protein [Bryobacteraceae bacterium]